MKKILLSMVLVILTASMAFGAGTVTQSVDKYPDLNMRVLTFVCTADASDGTCPSTATSTVVSGLISGYYITEVRTSPGGTAPTGGATVALNTSDSPAFDILGGVATVSATATTRFVPKLNATSSTYGGASVTGPLTLVIAGNSVNSAIITVKVILWKQ